MKIAMSIITPPLKSLPPYRRATYVTGAILIGLGLMLLLSQYLQATWIAVMLIPILGFVLLSQLLPIPFQKAGLGYFAKKGCDRFGRVDGPKVAIGQRLG